MDAITYTLAPQNETPSRYRESVDRLTGEVLRYASLNTSVPRRYVTSLYLSGTERLRSEGEYAYDVLSLGVLWRAYGARAAAANPPALLLLDVLSRLRLRPALTRILDPLRGWLAARLLGIRGGADAPVPTLRRLRALLRWLCASGEFRREEPRLRSVVRYLSSLTPGTLERDLASIMRFAGWFDARAAVLLGRYTDGVGRFLRDTHPSYAGREDAIFTGRGPAEYHAGMAGAEIMNRAFRAAFRRTAAKAVLLPLCMRLRGDRCAAVADGLELRCTACSATCAVNRLTRAGARLGFTVHVIPHASDFPRWLDAHAAGRDVGVVGVACPLNLVDGGLALRALGIPAQCVPLISASCRTHWHPRGVPTEVDERELLRLLGHADAVLDDTPERPGARCAPTADPCRVDAR